MLNLALRKRMKSKTVELQEPILKNKEEL
jgi:hypothetical protein